MLHLSSTSSLLRKKPSNSAFDGFVANAAARMWVYAVAGETGLARAPSREMDGREVVFLWSDRAEAEKWAGCIVENPRIKELPLAEVLTQLLPALHEHERKVGTDWSDGPEEPETEPLALAEALRAGMVEAFARRAKESGSVYVVGDQYGPAMLVPRGNPAGLMLPCWSVRDRAEMRLEGPWETMVVGEVPLDTFIAQTLPGLEETGALVCPDNLLGVETPELAPAVLRDRLK